MLNTSLDMAIGNLSKELNNVGEAVLEAELIHDLANVLDATVVATAIVAILADRIGLIEHVLLIANFKIIHHIFSAHIEILTCVGTEWAQAWGRLLQEQIEVIAEPACHALAILLFLAVRVGESALYVEHFYLVAIAIKDVFEKVASMEC